MCSALASDFLYELGGERGILLEHNQTIKVGMLHGCVCLMRTL